MNVSRRQFLDQAALGLLGAGFVSSLHAAERSLEQTGAEPPVVVSTWPFGKPANDAALQTLLGGGSNLDAVEQGIRVTETDPAVTSVGLKGKTNAAGVVQLDACIMSGPGHRAGGVAALEGIRHPISAARLVMEKTPHVLLVGEGARMFALEQGLESVEVDTRAQYDKWRHRPAAQPTAPPTANKQNHDTIALLVLGADGNLAGGCSTNGLAGKLPGRVGDSPLIGSGLYVDNEVGAAGATGVGENVMRYCGTFMVVEFMRQGMHPRAACEATIRRIARQDPRGLNLSINFIALDRQGRYGAAGTDKGFQFAAATRAGSRVLQPGLVARLDAEPTEKKN